MKRVIKRFFLILVLPVYLTFRFFALLGNKDSCFASFSQAVSLVPGKVGIYIRAAFYRLACSDTSDEISIGFLTILSHTNTSIAKGVYIGPQSNIGMCRIGENTLIGSGVHILSGKSQHNFDDLSRPIQEQGGSFHKIVIGQDVWIGNSSVVLANIGDHTVIGAGSVVTNDIAQASILAGNPAKILRHRT